MSDNEHRDSGPSGDWFYCLKHHTVEKGPECRAADRLGPYASREDASRAVETAHEHSEQWDTDPRWNDDETSGDK
ncbi:hypothetical protein [Streptomyces sp. NPDC005573]|uniref:hypothetical protein n=1 Tax=Streptomyces sp. NPDC005573 TaxID=3156890 RepID=UPI0033B59C80